MSCPNHVALMLVVALVASCGYRTLSPLDESGMTSVAVPLFDNRTFEPVLEARVTERVKSRLIASGPWRLVNPPEQAALVIRGVVVAFAVTTVSFDANNRPQGQRIAITADIAAESPHRGPFHVVLTGTAEYTETNDSLQTRAAKNRAIEEAADGLAETLVARIHAHQLQPETRTPSTSEGTPAAP